MNLDSQWRPRRSARPLIFAGVAVVALAGGAGAGYAATHSTAATGSPAAVVAAGPSSAPTPSSASPGTGKAPFGHRGFRFFGGLGFGLGALGGGVVHGQVTVPKSGGGYQSLDIQNGTVTAVSSSSVTVKSADGFIASYTVTGNTLVNAKSAGIGSVKKGDTVFVAATVSGSTATAAQVIDLSAIKSGRASFGFPFRDGKRPALPGSAAQPPGA